jgi:pseudaminic acid synthase
MKNFILGSKEVGEYCPVYIIAEMSANHCGSYEKAIETIHAAKECGADAIKLQTYRADTITLDCDSNDFKIPSHNPWSDNRSLYSLYEKAFTPWKWHKGLFKEAKKIGIDIFSSPFDESAVDLLEELNCPVYKIASPEVTHIPMIERIAKTKKPVIISTGCSRKDDIELALSTLRKNGCSEIVVLKCTASYPAPISELNLLTISDIPKAFNCFAGLSDHTLGIVSPIVSVSLGAKVIEKHFLPDKSDDSVDGHFSLGREEFKQMVETVREAEQSLGNITYDLGREGEKSFWLRRSLYISKEVKAGDTISRENIKCVRPSHGLHPLHFNSVLGKKFNKDIKIGTALSMGDIV